MEPVTVKLKGRIDSVNAAEVKQQILEKLAGRDGEPVVLDLDEITYVSSAGLRVFLQISKQHRDFSLVNVRQEIYELLEMTGFTEIMKVRRAYVTISVEGCEVVGEGANGKVYRIDRDHVVKTYKNDDALEDIRHEREMARLAFILGIPTAISYDVVKVGDSYGSVFELLNATAFSSILREHPEQFDWCVREYADLLVKMHSTQVPPGKLPSMKERAMGQMGGMIDVLAPQKAAKLQKLAEAVPEQNTLIHGDYHTKNITLAGDEVLVIDMDTLAVGHPVFELAQMYNSFIGFGEMDHSITEKFLGYDSGIGRSFWKESLKAYLGTEDENRIKEVEEKARCVAYTRLIDWSIRHCGFDDETRNAERALWIRELEELLDRLDSLCFDNDRLHVPL